MSGGASSAVETNILEAVQGSVKSNGVDIGSIDSGKEHALAGTPLFCVLLCYLPIPPPICK